MNYENTIRPKKETLYERRGPNVETGSRRKVEEKLPRTQQHRKIKKKESQNQSKKHRNPKKKSDRVGMSDIA